MSFEISSVVKEKSSEILSAIKKAEAILLHCHPMPDPDSVGSALAMKAAIDQFGRKATIIQGDSEISTAFQHFPGIKNIQKKSFADINLSDYDLFIIVDCGGLDMVSKKIKVKFPPNLKTIVIDHHASNHGFGDVNLIDISSSATAFVIYQLFLKWRIDITHSIALNLLMGMYSDSGGFKYPPADYRLLQAAAECAQIAPEYIKLLFDIENSETKDSIYFMTLALDGVETFCNDTVAISAVSYDSWRSKKININNIGNTEIANTLRSVIGWNIAISMFEIEPNHFKLSFRTRDASKFNVAKLATALGGGGHRAAAGAHMHMPLSDAKKMVIDKIGELYGL